MKKTMLILLFGLLTNIVMSQEIQEQYLYKKEKIRKKTQWNSIDSDSLVLYKNGTFHRTRLYHFHELMYSELKGEWNIKNDTLFLNVQLKKEDQLSKKWTEINAIIQYRIKRKKLKPINGIEFLATHYLNRIKIK